MALGHPEPAVGSFEGSGLGFPSEEGFERIGLGGVSKRGSLVKNLLVVDHRVPEPGLKSILDSLDRGPAASQAGGVHFDGFDALEAVYCFELRRGGEKFSGCYRFPSWQIKEHVFRMEGGIPRVTGL